MDSSEENPSVGGGQNTHSYTVCAKLVGMTVMRIIMMRMIIMMMITVIIITIMMVLSLLLLDH